MRTLSTETPRERIIEQIVQAMQVVNDDLRLPNSIWYGLAEAALSSLEQPLPTSYEIKPCTCGHNGYGKHMLGCELYG
jgi:hypothetical protein